MDKSLAISRRQLAHGVGQTTQRNRKLPIDSPAVPIPERVGRIGPVVVLPDELWSPWWGYDHDPFLEHSGAPTLVSSDGVWRLKTSLQERKYFFTNDDTQIDLRFAGPGVPGNSSPHAGYVKIYEPSYEAREWHPKTFVRFFTTGLVGVAQRLKSITLRQDEYSFKWSFANDGDTTQGYSTEVILNRTVSEKGLAHRAYIGVSKPDAAYLNFHHLQYFYLSDGSTRGKVSPYAGTPYNQLGFLRSLYEHAYTFHTGTEMDTMSSLNNASDLSRLLIAGQAYHGLCSYAGVKTANELLLHPTGYLQPTSGATRYFKSPYAPALPLPEELPDGFTASGKQYLSDVVLKCGTDYAPSSTSGALTPSQWLHVDDLGIVRVLGVVRTAWTNSTTTFQIRNYGPVRLTTAQNPYTPVPGVLATITLTTTDSYANALTRDSNHPDTYTGSPDYQTLTNNWGSAPQAGGTADQTGYPDVDWQHVMLNQTIMVEASPDGRQIALMRGFFNMHDKFTFWNLNRYCHAQNLHVILTVATVDISSALVVSAPVVVFQWQNHYPTNFSASAVVSNPQVFASLGTWWFDYQFDNIVSAGDSYTQQECVGFSYRKNGTLKLDLVEHDYGPLADRDLYTDHDVLWDSGIPSTDPAPTVGLYAVGTVNVSAYVINGGFGWTQLYSRATDFPSPPNRDDYYAITSYRVTNNVLWYKTYYWDYGDDVTLEESVMVSTEAKASLDELFITPTGFTKYTSYNPRTLEIASQNIFSGIPITFI